MSDEAGRARVEGLRSSVKIWRDVSMRITNDMSQLRILEKFAKKAIESGSYAEAKEWLENTYKDNPKTSINEGVSFEQLNKLYKKLHGEEFKDSTTDELKENISDIKGDYRKLYARHYMVRTMVSGIQKQIENIQTAQNEADIVSGGDGGE